MALHKNKGGVARVSCIASVTLLSYVGSAFAWTEGNGNDGGHAASIVISNGSWAASTNSDEAIALGTGTYIGNNSDFSTAIGMTQMFKIIRILRMHGVIGPMLGVIRRPQMQSVGRVLLETILSVPMQLVFGRKHFQAMQTPSASNQ